MRGNRKVPRCSETGITSGLGCFHMQIILIQKVSEKQKRLSLHIIQVYMSRYVIVWG